MQSSHGLLHIGQGTNGNALSRHKDLIVRM